MFSLQFCSLKELSGLLSTPGNQDDLLLTIPYWNVHVSHHNFDMIRHSLNLSSCFDLLVRSMTSEVSFIFWANFVPSRKSVLLKSFSVCIRACHFHSNLFCYIRLLSWLLRHKVSNTFKRTMHCAIHYEHGFNFQSGILDMLHLRELQTWLQLQNLIWWT